MRLDRHLVLAGVLLLAGCVSAAPPGAPTPDKMPKVSKADQATDAARIHTELGQHYMQEGDLQTAQAKLQRALQFDPNYAPAHTVIAVLYQRIGDMPNAELHYRRAQELQPTNGGANNNLGAFLCKVGRPAEADAYFKKALNDPFYQTPEFAWINAGMCKAQTNDFRGAEADFRKALTLNPQSPDALFQLANTLYLNNDALHARAFLQRFDALGQATPAGLKLGRDIESRLGNSEAASNYTKRLQSQFPDSEQAHAFDATAKP